jgi:hypothetical protein
VKFVSEFARPRHRPGVSLRDRIQLVVVGRRLAAALLTRPGDGPPDFRGDSASVRPVLHD